MPVRRKFVSKQWLQITFIDLSISAKNYTFQSIFRRVLNRFRSYLQSRGSENDHTVEKLGRKHFSRRVGLNHQKEPKTTNDSFSLVVLSRLMTMIFEHQLVRLIHNQSFFFHMGLQTCQI